MILCKDNSSSRTRLNNNSSNWNSKLPNRKFVF